VLAIGAGVSLALRDLLRSPGAHPFFASPPQFRVNHRQTLDGIDPRGCHDFLVKTINTVNPANQGALSPGPSPSDLSAILQDHPFLRSMPRPFLEQIAPCASLLDVSPGDLIFKQGDAADKFYLLLQGSVTLTHAGMKGNVPIQTLAGAEALGWSCLFPPYAWRFNAVATEPSRLVALNGDRLRQLCQEDTPLGYDLMRRVAEVVVQRLHSTRQKLMKLTDAR
jgi:CRP/FNR family transcriptional regulator, cyclic AMP receptor protein